MLIRVMDATLTDEQLAVAHALERVIGWLRQTREPLGLSLSTLSALSRLDAAGALRISELAEREGLTQPGMTTLINRLEAGGLAARTADPTDRRAVLVTITPTGTEHINAYRRSRAELIGARVGLLQPDDQEALMAAVPALERLIADSTDTRIEADS
jgi:DNA-binding MarR family transcriptional regulator